MAYDDTLSPLPEPQKVKPSTRFSSCESFHSIGTTLSDGASLEYFDAQEPKPDDARLRETQTETQPQSEASSDTEIDSQTDSDSSSSLESSSESPPDESNVGWSVPEVWSLALRAKINPDSGPKVKLPPKGHVLYGEYQRLMRQPKGEGTPPATTTKRPPINKAGPSTKKLKSNLKTGPKLRSADNNSRRKS